MPALAIGAALLKAAALVAINVVVSAIFKPKKPTVEPPDTEQSRTRQLSNKEPMNVVIGRRIVGGTTMFDDTFGDELSLALEVTTISCKDCGVDKVWGDSEELTFATFPTSTEQAVTNHYLGKDDAQRAKVAIFDGATRPGSYLNGKNASWFSTDDDFGEDTVFIAITENTDDDIGGPDDDEDIQGEVFIPFQGRARFQSRTLGDKVCDPRDGGDYDDESTYVRSTNPALVYAQWQYGWYTGGLLAVGLGYPVELLDLDQIESDADYCDAQSFECHGPIRSGSAEDGSEILKTFGGVLERDRGKVYAVAEGNRPFAETIDLDEHPAAQVIGVDLYGPATERPTWIDARYAEESAQYTLTDLPRIYANGTGIEAGRVPRDRMDTYSFITNRTQAAHIQKINMAVARAAATMQLAGLPYRFDAIARGSVVSIANSGRDEIDDRDWIVKGKGVEGPKVTLYLREYAGSTALAAPTTPAASDLPITGRPFTDIRPGSYAGGSLATGTAGRLEDLRTGRLAVEDILIDGVGNLTGELEAVDNNTGTGGSSEGVSVTVSPTSAFKYGDETPGDVTTNTVTASATGGDDSFTYSWAFVSGGTGITINNGSTATASFTGDPSNGTLFGVVRVTATTYDTPSAGDISGYRDVNVTIAEHDANGLA